MRASRKAFSTVETPAVTLERAADACPWSSELLGDWECRVYRGKHFGAPWDVYFSVDPAWRLARKFGMEPLAALPVEELK